ncbi:hypothetical protein RRG08_064175 [Elysia crispata]|uniref:Uncharacterized protein n=1 Tax=Elysia crispata TaxID=231223 RepID=A0AAE1CY16_9GAST|nr:hypothetical protein RRG08_064175 [Elysia crispata]
MNIILLVCILNKIFLASASCVDGWFGSKCALQCHCFGEVKCDQTSGNCKFGCDPGWNGPGCQMTCSARTWGENCSSPCCSLCENHLCHPTNGSCVKCSAGQDCDIDCMADRETKVTSNSSKDCPDTFWGRNCMEKCCSLCEDQLCDPVLGSCYQCPPGLNCLKDCYVARTFTSKENADVKTNTANDWPKKEANKSVLGLIIFVAVAVILQCLLIACFPSSSTKKAEKNEPETSSLRKTYRSKSFVSSTIDETSDNSSYSSESSYTEKQSSLSRIETSN